MAGQKEILPNKLLSNFAHAIQPPLVIKKESDPVRGALWS